MTEGTDSRIVPGTASAPDRKGVYSAVVEIHDPSTGRWVTKRSTFFPDRWSQEKVTFEIRAASRNRISSAGRPRSCWEGMSPSGLHIAGYLDAAGTITVAYPMRRRRLGMRGTFRYFKERAAAVNEWSGSEAVVRIFLEHDVQTDAGVAREAVDAIRAVEAGETPSWEATGNAFSLTITPGRAHLANVWAPEENCVVAPGDLATELERWIAFLEG